MAHSHNRKPRNISGIEPYPDDKALDVLSEMLSKCGSHSNIIEAALLSDEETKATKYGLQVAINIINGEGDPITMSDVEYSVAILQSEISTLRLKQQIFQQDTQAEITKISRVLETLLKKIKDATEQPKHSDD